MGDFRIEAINDDFNHWFSLSDSNLGKLGCVKMIVDAYPGYPCRISLEDAKLGEEVILLPYEHHAKPSPYRASGPIFVRKNAVKPTLKKNEIPLFLNHRHLSLRGYDESGMMLEASTCYGDELNTLLDRIFKNADVSYIHIHNAGPGCYNCIAKRIA